MILSKKRIANALISCLQTPEDRFFSREGSGRLLDLRQRGSGFEPYWRHCVVSLSMNINPSLVLVKPRKACSFITERLLMGRKSNRTDFISCPVI